MRILLLNDRIPPENRGGAGEVVWRLAVELQRTGHDVHVITATDKPSFEEQRDSIPTYHLHVKYPDRFRAWLSLYNPQVNNALRELYQKIQPDVINAHNVHQFLTYNSLRIAHDMRIPIVFSSHDVMLFAYQKMSYFIQHDRCGVESVAEYRLPAFFNLKQMRLRYNPMRNLVIRHYLKQYTQVRTAPSQELCHAHHANDLPHFEVVHNGIDAETFSVSEATIEALRQRLNLQGRKVILFAGRLTGAKGTYQLLDALKQVVQEVPSATLFVLSSVPIEQQIQAANYQTLRDNHIVSGGWLSGDDLSAAFHLADVMVAPSIVFDTFPTVNLEAMASHSVVLASCYGGSHEVVVDGETGYIINPFDIEDFAEKLSQLLQDEALRQAMAEKAYQRVISHFTIDQQATQMLQKYQQAVDTYE